jgi:hemoglobin/transferrin/lactoferrin receptor protein
MNRQLLGFFAATALAASGMPASAQENAGDLQPLGTGVWLDPITIYATLSPTDTFEFPGQVSVVGQEEIETSQANSVADVLKSVPGVYVDGGARRSGQAPTIRGFREEDILILVDGVKQSFISGHDGRLFIDPELLKTAEVVKGPMSALYGSGALGGVIALTTVDAADFLEAGETMGVKVKAGFQSVNEEYSITSTGFARSHDGKFDVVSSFTYRESGDVDLGNGTTLPDEEQIKSSLVKGTAQLTEDLKFVGTWVHFQNDAFNPNNPQGNTTTDLQDRYVQSDTVSGKLSWAPAGNPWIDGNLLVYWARHVSEEDDFDTTRLTERTIETTGINIDNRSRFDLAPGTKLTLTYGAEYYVDAQTADDNAPIGGGLNNVPDADASYYGTFAQAEFKFDKPLGAPGELTIIPGIRWDGFENSYKGEADYDDYEDTAISKKLGVSYKPIDWLLLFGSYGEAFRAPSYTELYAQGIHFPGGLETVPIFPGSSVYRPTGGLMYNRFLANPFLVPQDGVTLEGGLGFDFKDVAIASDRLTIKGSYWTTDASNFIDLQVEASGCGSFEGPPFVPTNPANCYTQFFNRNAELDGIEIELKYDAPRFYLGFAYTHIDGVDTDTGEYLGILQPDKFYMDAGVKAPEIWARFGTRLTFADDFTKVNEPGTERDAYTLIDVYASFEPEDGPFKGFRLDLGIDNITDEAYEVIEAGVYEEGVNYKAALSYTHKW